MIIRSLFKYVKMPTKCHPSLTKSNHEIAIPSPHRRWGWVPFLRVAKADPDFKSALDVLWSPENLGKDRVTLPPCKNVKSVPSEVRPPDKTFIWDDQDMTPRTLANAALDMSASNKNR